MSGRQVLQKDCVRKQVRQARGGRARSSILRRHQAGKGELPTPPLYMSMPASAPIAVPCHPHFCWPSDVALGFCAIQVKLCACFTSARNSSCGPASSATSSATSNNCRAGSQQHACAGSLAAAQKALHPAHAPQHASRQAGSSSPGWHKRTRRAQRGSWGSWAAA